MSGGAQGFADFDYPRRLAKECERAEFAKEFGSEESCERWLRQRRWPAGFSCPLCRSGGRWVAERRGYQCMGTRCRRFTSLTAGTILHGTRKPLRKWFEALYLVVQRGVNARTLQREIGLTYKVAWAWGHKLRGLLGGHAVPEETRARERHARFDAERTSGGPNPRRPDPKRPGPCGCSKLEERNWSWVDDHEPTNRERLEGGRLDFEAARLDAWASWELLATYWGSVTEKHLRDYLDELAFRRNRRRREVRESFLAVAPELARARMRTYESIVAKPAPAATERALVVIRRSLRGGASAS